MTPTMYWFLQDDDSIMLEAVPDISVVHECALAPQARRLLVVDSTFLQEFSDVCLVHPALNSRFSEYPFKNLQSAYNEVERRAALIR